MKTAQQANLRTATTWTKPLIDPSVFHNICYDKALQLMPISEFRINPTMLSIRRF